jgi:hypothetical protein
MTEQKNSDVTVTTFDDNGNIAHSDQIRPTEQKESSSTTKKKKPPKVPKKYEKIVPAIRRRFENEQPTAEETVVLLQYFEVKSVEFLCSKIPSGTRIRLCGEEDIFHYDNKKLIHSGKDALCNMLYIDFFDKGGWIEKNIKYRDLNDDELFHKFDVRIYNVLRRAVPKEQAKVKALSEVIDFFKYKDGTTAAEQLEAKAVTLGEVFDVETARAKARAVQNEVDDYVIFQDVEDVPDIQTFKEQKLKEYTEHPEILLNHIKRKYKDDELICRWLVNTFEVKDDWIKSIMMPCEAFFQYVQAHYTGESGDWHVVIARESSRFEAGRRLVGKIGDERDEILEEMYRFYVKYDSSIRKSKIDESAGLAYRTIMKAIDDGKTRQRLTKFIHLEHDYRLERRRK